MANAVAIRIGTSGKNEVKNDFAEIKTAGTGAMQSIVDGARKTGDAGEQQAQRLAASYERATEDMLAADRRRAAAAQKLAAVTPQSSVQQVIAVNTGTGFNDNTKSARESAIIMAQLIDEQERYNQRIVQFRAELDPAYAAQQRFDREMVEARTLISSGGITLDQYCQKLRQETALLEETTNAQNRAGAGAGAHRAAMQGLSYQVQDTFTQLSMGANVFQVIAIQGGQAVGQFAHMEGAAGKFATFMMGGWGLAIQAGLFGLGMLTDGLLDNEDAAGKAERAQRSYAEVLRDGKSSYEEITKAAADYASQGEKSRQVTILQIQAEAAATAERLRGAIAIRQAMQASLEAYQQQVRLGPTGPGGQGQIGALAGASVSQDQLDQNAKAIEALVKSADEVKIKAADAIAAINLNPTKAGFEILRAEAKSTIKDVTELSARLTAIGKQEQAWEASRNRRGSANSSAQANVGDMTALVKQLFPGATITSTTGGKHVKGSDHYAGRAIDFVPAGGMGKYTTDEVERILRDAGVDIRRNASGKEQMFGPGRAATKPGDHNDHFHFAWQGSASPEGADRRASAAAERAERDRDQGARRAAALAGMSADLDNAILDAKRNAITDGATLAQFAKGQIDAESDKYLASLAAKVETQDLTKAQADELATKRVYLDRLKDQQLDTDEAARKAAEVLTLQSAANDNQRDLLNGQLGLATTTRERLPLAMRLLDLDKEEERLRLQAVIDRAALGKATAAEAQAARARLGDLDQIYGDRAKATARENESPMQAYLREINVTGDQMNEKLESVGVNGLRSFTGELSDAIVNFKSLGSVAKHVLAEIAADLLKMQMQKSISGLIGGALGALGGALGGGVSGVDYGAIGGAANSIRIPGFATGTEYFSGGTALVGEQGQELVELPTGSKIHNASATRRMLANDNGPSFHMPINIDARGADEAGLARVEAQLARMEREMPDRAVAAVQDWRDRNHWDRGRAA